MPRRSSLDPYEMGHASEDFPVDPVPLSAARATPVSWLWPGRIPLNKLTVLDGDPGLGKSSVLLDVVARLTTGRPMPDCDPSTALRPGNAVLLCAEDGTTTPCVPASRPPAPISTASSPSRTSRASPEIACSASLRMCTPSSDSSPGTTTGS